MEKMQKMLFIFNPNTGGNRLKNQLLELLRLFSKAGYEVTVFPTAAPGDARRAVETKAPGYDLVVCCGGDGTLNEVVDGLMQLVIRPRLGYIPGGTTNDFASSLKIPKANMLAAAERIVQPKREFLCDIGCLNTRAFTYVAAFGAFTDVSYTTPQPYKNVLGYFAYVLEAVQRLPHLPFCRVSIKTQEAEWEEELLFGMVTNSTSVGGFAHFAPEDVRLDDGLFEVLLVRRPHNLGDFGALSVALLKRDTSSEYVKALRVNSIAFYSDEPLSWTLDGEFGGKMKRARIEVVPRTLTICT